MAGPRSDREAARFDRRYRVRAWRQRLPVGHGADYQNCYDPSWGRHKARTRPVAGNHEYDTRRRQGRTTTTSAPMPDRRARLLQLRSRQLARRRAEQQHCCRRGARRRRRGSATISPRAPARCTIAYWHFPLFSSSKHGNIEADARVLAHPLRRRRRRRARRRTITCTSGSRRRIRTEARTRQRGIREFIAGTGGAPPYPFVDVKPNSEVRLSTVGVLKLALKAGGYDWNFIPVSGAGDSGSGSCH